MNVFVYGTLRRGGGNDYLLRGSKPIGLAKTVNNYTMFIRGIPYVNKNIETYPILGEVYEVNSSTLDMLDELENHPDWYTREPIRVRLEETGEIITASIYFNNFSSDIPHTSGDYFEPFDETKTIHEEIREDKE